MKKDIKYIIKRIIIGVGIAFGVMLVKSLPVFADEKEQIASCQFGRNPDSQFVSYKNDCTKYIQNVGLKKDPDNFNEALTYEFPFYDATFHFKYETSQTNSKYMIYYDEENNSYIIIYLYTDGKNAKFSTKGTGNDTQFIYTGDTSYSVSYYNYTNIITPKQIEKYEKMYNNSNNNIIKTEISNDKSEKLYLYQYDNGALTSLQSYGSVEMFNPKNLKLIKTNFENVYVEDEKINVEEIKEVPDGYEMIDMLGKDAVLFYPKDFREIDNVCSETSSIIGGSAAMCNQFDYYYTFYLKGSFDTALKNLGLNSSEYDRVALENYTKATEYTKIVKSNYYDTGILFYPTNISSGTGSVASSEYKVYYDSSKLNYIIIDNIDDFTGEDISYIDKNGDEVSTKIDSVKKRTDIEYSGSDDFNVDYDENSIKSFDISSGFKSFINMLSDGVSFFKKYMGEFMKDIPQFVFYFVIFIPILSIVVAVIKIINR